MTDRVNQEHCAGATGQVKVIRIGDRSIKFHGDEADGYFRHLVDNHWNNRHMEAYVRANVPQDGTCFDVGANIGVTAIFMALWCRAGHVYAFEASARNVDFLRRSLAENGIGNCTVIPCAVGSERGHSRFAMADFAASSHVVQEGLEMQPGATITDVPMIRLDDFVSGEPTIRRLDFVKIDVEGHEPHVLRGAAATLGRFVPPIYLEFNAWSLLRTQGISPFLFAAALWRAGEVLTVLDDGTTVPAAGGSLDNFLFETLVDRRMMQDVLILPRAGADWEVFGRCITRPEAWERLYGQAASTAPQTAAARADAARLAAELQAVYRSTSWKVTAPLRALRRVVARGRRPRRSGVPDDRRKL